MCVTLVTLSGGAVCYDICSSPTSETCRLLTPLTTTDQVRHLQEVMTEKIENGYKNPVCMLQAQYQLIIHREIYKNCLHGEYCGKEVMDLLKNIILGENLVSNYPPQWMYKYNRANCVLYTYSHCTWRWSYRESAVHQRRTMHCKGQSYWNFKKTWCKHFGGFFLFNSHTIAGISQKYCWVGKFCQPHTHN